MVARRPVAAAEDDVAPDLGRRGALGRNGAFAIFDPGETRRRGREGAAHVEAESRPRPAREAGARFGRGKQAAGSRVERRAVRIANAGCGARDLGARAKAGVDETLPVEPRQRRGVVVAMLALAAPRRGKAKSEPREVVDDRGLELRLAPGAVQVFNAQNQAPAGLGGEALVHERRIGVAEMERAVRRWRKAQHGRGREDVIGHGGEAHA